MVMLYKVIKYTPKPVLYGPITPPYDYRSLHVSIEETLKMISEDRKYLFYIIM